MTVKEAIKLINYGMPYEIDDIYSEKICHRSYVNTDKHLEKYLDKEVASTPFYATTRVKVEGEVVTWTTVMVIRMEDNDSYKKKLLMIV